MGRILINKKVAILVADGFEESELTQPFEELEKVHAKVTLISTDKLRVRAWNHGIWGNEYHMHGYIGETDFGEFDALVLPGGLINADKLRTNGQVVKFVSQFMENSKLIGAISYSPSILIETGKLSNKTLTSSYSIKSDLINAGAKWVDEKVVAANGLITCQDAAGLPLFCTRLIQSISEYWNFSPQRQQVYSDYYY